MNVRRATIADLPILVEFTSNEALEAESKPIDSARLEKGIGAALEDNAKAIYWVLIDEDGKPIGSISTLKEWSDWNAGFYWWVQSVYLVPEQRGKGHISILIDTVKEEMKRENGLELRLYVHNENKRAIRAYEKLSFKQLPYNIMALKNDL